MVQPQRWVCGCLLARVYGYNVLWVLHSYWIHSSSLSLLFVFFQRKGWWTGNSPKCGMDDKNPVKVAYQDACHNMWQGACDNYGRDSWDLNTV